ncbi:RCC1 domain-containing protein [Aspergillus chevalieri]|uniref:Mitochondrial protein Fmp25 n=1 Tax=Aspergillus chevalieri TaxID=182096 RepID=A0A7R7ZKD2_ASPCH|nr:uncharacterized protein ACHE_21083S [Aspergillus chevalieri]BCR85625.1 hypothetical protein ACHE_21083S [Aspergillus chevalieri]
MWANRARQPTTNILTLSRLVRARQPAISSWRRYASTNRGASNNSNWFRNSLGFAGAGTAAFLAYIYATTDSNKTGEETKAKGLPKIKEDLGTQLVQKKRSLRSPGVYLWGTNAYRVVDPDSKESVIKTPRSLSYFDGQMLRDLKLEEKSGAAINEKGDLIQWGKGFSESEFKPTETLIGKNLTSLCMSSDRILALSSDGKVYSLPISKEDQQSGRKPKESSWVMPFLSGEAGVSYRRLQPNLGMTEKITAISGGSEHALLLTSSGRVFSVASSMESYPAFGQLGIPGLTWSTRPSGPVDICHEITTLKGTKITQVAAGDYHSLALSKDGQVFAFGDNSFGQLGVEYNASAPFIDTPVLLPVSKLYRANEWAPTVTQVAAGGANSFFTVDAQRVLGRKEDASAVRDLGCITADTWTCGRGIWGLLGNGKWTHLQDEPTKVKALSGLSEFDESTQKVSPIRLRDISVGTTHAAAVMGNSTHIHSASTKALETNEDWGYDALWWGGNEHYQLGTGKRSNLARPTYINAPPAPEDKDKEEARLQVMPRHKGKAGKRTLTMEQRVECGRHVSGLYSAV